MKYLSEFWDFVDNRRIVRRSAFYVMLYITIRTAFWTWEFAAHAGNHTDVGIAAIIAAVWGPITVMQTAVFAFYNSGRTSTEGAQQ